MKKVISERDLAKKFNLDRIDLVGNGLFLEFDKAKNRIKIGGPQPRFQEVKYAPRRGEYITHEKLRIYLDTFKKY